MGINFPPGFLIARCARQVLSIFSIVLAIAACSKGGDEPPPPLTYAFTPSGLAARVYDKPIINNNVTTFETINILRWPRASGATKYNIYWSHNPGVTKTTGTKIANVTELSYEHTGLTNGVPYYYVYTVETAAGESYASPELVLTPNVTLPGAPPSVEILGMDGHVEIIWYGEEGALQGATAYNIYWKTSPGVTTTDTKISDATSPTVVPGLENNKVYYVAVSAVIDGVETLSAEVAAIPFAPPPLVVTPGALPQTPHLVSAYAGNKQMSLWAEDSADALRYHIYWNDNGAEITTADAKISDVLLPFTQTGLTDGKRYFYRVAAVNEHGESALSAQVSVTPNNDKISALVVTDSALNTCITDMAMMYGWSYVRQVEHLVCIKSSIVYLTGLEKLTNLYHLKLSGSKSLNTGVDALAPMALLVNLEYLEMDGTGINNIDFVAGLTNLVDLRINENNISDLTPLEKLVHLNMLDMDTNQIVNVKPLAKLTELNELWVQSNFIVDVSPLAGLTQLTKLVLSNNDIVNVSPIKYLTGLINLYLQNNLIGGLGNEDDPKSGSVETLKALTKAEKILLNGNPTMSCAGLGDLVGSLRSSVVDPTEPINGVNCKGP